MNHVGLEYYIYFLLPAVRHERLSRFRNAPLPFRSSSCSHSGDKLRR